MSDIVFTTQTTPATPGSGKADVFVDSSTKQVKSVNDAGVVAAYLTEAGHNVAAAVHGLPASVNVLGNRSAAGKFIQEAASTGTVNATSYAEITVTWPVAFAAITFACAWVTRTGGGANCAAYIEPGVNAGNGTLGTTTFAIPLYNRGANSMAVSVFALGVGS